MKVWTFTGIVVLLGLTAVVEALRCPAEGKCSVKLIIAPKLTMMNGGVRVRPCNGRLCVYNQNVPLEPEVDNTIITMDGVYARLVFSVNGQVPGPEIIAYEGQEMEVIVTNKLHTDSVTVHFHGIHQVGTPYMDGVAFVTQCPILPGHTFNYTFTASPHGTHWYHAHIGDQRSLGLYGPYIVLRKDEPIEYVDEHIITIQDWNHDMDPETAYQKMINGVYDCTLLGDSCTKYQTTKSVDGARFSVFQFHSGLINGRGRYYINGSKAQHNNAPLTTYNVEPGKTYRFRVISAATLYPFRVYVAGHKLTVIASDGREIEPVEVESFIVHTGERMDFLLNASQSDGNYMVVAETLEVLETGQIHAAEAILSYGNRTASVIDKPVECDTFPEGKCPVLNCPFTYYPKVLNRSCITFHEVTAKMSEVPPDYQQIISATADKTFFLNFAFPGVPGNTPGSINGKQYIEPRVNSYAQPKELDQICSSDKCGPEKICECTPTIEIEENQIIDLVFLNMGTGRGWSHPVHLHGHSFYVVAMGFPDYDVNTGLIIRQNPAVDCRGSYCNDATWAGRGRKRRQVDAERRPPLKDTIVVPTHGYVIVRFKADNPGVWFLHCHIDLHNTNGMAMLVNESFSKHPATPAGMPRCRDYLGEDTAKLEKPIVCRSSGLYQSVALIVLISTLAIYLQLE